MDSLEYETEDPIRAGMREVRRLRATQAMLLAALKYWIPLREIIDAADSNLLTEALARTEAAIEAAEEGE